MIRIMEALTTAICEEQRDVGLRPFTGVVDEMPITNAVRMDGVLEDCQRVIAFSAALLADSAHTQSERGAVPWEEVQLELLNDLQDLIVNIVQDIDGDHVFIIFPNVPYSE